MSAPGSDRDEARERPPLLFLCHRVPYPPNKGDKIRAFHVLRELAAHFAVHLGTFIDDPADRGAAAALDAFCVSRRCEWLPPRLATLRSGLGLLTGQPLSLPYYHCPALARWVRETLARERVERVFLLSSVMGRFLPEGFDAGRLVVDFVDVDSDKWTQYAPSRPWPLSWLYRREGRRLRDWECALAARADVSLLVSRQEAALFRERCPSASGSIGHLDNGVDTEYFAPVNGGPSPYPDGAEVLVFTGAMDYWPNVDAVRYFARDLFPALRARRPQLQFWIVGGKPTDAVQALAGDGVVVTGRVADVRPYLAHARAAVAPLRIARGVQNKVLEAMAMAKPVLVSARGLEGIAAQRGAEVLVCETVDDYLAALPQLAGAAAEALGRRAREHVCLHADWTANLRPLLRMLAAPAAAPGSAA